jgi:asparagine synthase (glutamine-hydrolysing)
MCGIVGGVGTKFSQAIKEHFYLLNRRGPDHQKLLSLDNGLILGATRLAMTDPLPRSNQPMENSVTGDVIVFNGEIYNYKSIRAKLRKLGIYFDTESDTEVLLKSLNYFGLDFIAELEGMFSFGYYNKANNSIILSRDFLGKKPLYYYLEEDSFIFSSQIDYIKRCIGNVAIEDKALINYLILGYVVDPQTIYGGIRAVRPGEFIVLDLNTSKITNQRNYFPTALKNFPKQDLRMNISESISRRTVGHDSFALSLSGGVDSSIIALTSKNLGLNVNAFSMRWSESDKGRYNFDFDNASIFAKKLKIPFFAVDMPKVSSIPDLLTEFTKAMQEPNSNPSGLSMMVLYAKIAENGYRLVLTGDGADEVFGGYERYSISNKLRFLPRFSDYTISRLITIFNINSPKFEKFFAGISDIKSEFFWLYWQKIIDLKLLNIINKSNFNSLEIEFPSIALDLIDQSKNRVANLLVRDLKTWLIMESNRKLDRISMWNSIEARSPFLDENIVGQGFYGSYKKLGFISPLGFWLRENKDLVHDSLIYLNSNFNFDKNYLKILANAPEDGNFKEFRFLWSLIVLANWHINQS